MAVAVAAVAAGYQIFSGLEASRAQAEAERQNIDAMKGQAKELERRDYINREITYREGRQFISRQEAAFASNGIDIASSTGALDFLAEQHFNLGQQVELMRQQTVYDVGLLNRGVQIAGARVQEIQRAGNAQAVGQGLNFAANAYSSSSGKGK